jgi:hypothetical protein
LRLIPPKQWADPWKIIIAPKAIKTDASMIVWSVHHKKTSNSFVGAT